MRRLPVGAALATLALALAVAASAGTRSSRSTTFTDPTGDAGTAADITNVVASDDANGQITFQVNIANQFTNTNTVDILVDADHNPSSGDTQAAGAEYDLYVDFSNNTWDLGVWNGSGWSEAPSSSTGKVSYTSNQFTYSINKSELGNTSAFGFWVDSCDADCSAGHEDQAPANGTWFYQLTGGATSGGSGGGSSAVQLSVLVATGPKTVKAGKPYTVVLLLQPSDPSVSLVDNGQVHCKASIGTTSLVAQSELLESTFQGQKIAAAGCVARVPKTAHGKTVKETVTVTYQTATVSRTFSARVI
jgi:hypothetical protein